MNWYAEAFDDLYLRVYGPELDAARTADEVDGVLELTGLSTSAHVLDLGCGQGRHAIMLARAGLTVTGVDLSADLLGRARADARAAGVDVTWLHQDMRAPLGTASFDAALNLYNTFGYLEDEREDARVLAAVAEALVDGGVFLQEYGNREAQLRDFRPADVHRLDDGLCIIEERGFDLRTSRLTVDWTVLQAGRIVTRRRHSFRLYTATELVSLHADAGLHVEIIFGGLDGREPDLDDPLIVVRSRKG